MTSRADDCFLVDSDLKFKIAGSSPRRVGGPEDNDDEIAKKQPPFANDDNDRDESHRGRFDSIDVKSERHVIFAR